MVWAGAAALCAKACGAQSRAPRMAALKARRSDAKPDTFVPFGAGPSGRAPLFLCLRRHRLLQEWADAATGCKFRRSWLKRSQRDRFREHDPGKWESVFGKDH